MVSPAAPVAAVVVATPAVVDVLDVLGALAVMLDAQPPVPASRLVVVTQQVGAVEAERVGQLMEPVQAGRLRIGQAQPHAHAGLRIGLAPEGHATGEGELIGQGLEAFTQRQGIVRGQPGHEHGLPGQARGLDGDGGHLQFGLFGAGAKGRLRQGIDALQALAVGATATDELGAPVHGDVGLAPALAGAGARGDQHLAPA